jgi:Ankyrin repeats (many copies)
MKNKNHKAKSEYRIISSKLEQYRAITSNPSLIINTIFSALRANDLAAAKLLFKLLPNYKELIPSDKLWDFVYLLVKEDVNHGTVKFILDNINKDIVGELSSKKTTLLDGAVCYGAMKNAQLLLDNGANKIINNTDAAGNTVLIKAIKMNNAPMAELLLKYKAHANSSQGGYSALAHAMLQQNDKIKLALIKAGAKDTKENIARIKEIVASGALKIVSEKLKPIKFEEYEKLYCEGVANCYKGVFAADNRGNINFLNEAITKIKKSIQLQIEQNQLNVPNLQILFDLSNIVVSDKNEALTDFIIEIATKCDLHTILCQVHNNLNSKKILIGDVFAALSHAEQAKIALDKIAPGSIPESALLELSHNVHFNFGTVLIPIDPHKAVEHFIKALGYNKGDRTTIVYLHELYSALGQRDKASEVLKLVKNQNDSDLLSMHSTLTSKKLTKNEIDVISNTYNFDPRFGKAKSPENLQGISDNIKVEKLVANKEFESAVKYCSQKLENTDIYTFFENNEQLALYLTKLLKVYISFNAFDKGSQHLEKLYEQFPILKNHTHPALKYLEFVILQGAGKAEEADKILAFLNSKIEFGEELNRYASHANKLTFYHAIEKHDFTKAKLYIPYLGDNVNKEAVAKLLSTLEITKNQSSGVEEIESAKSEQEYRKDEPDAHEAELSDINLLVENITEDTASDLKKFDPKLIHQYFQRQKQNLIKQQYELVNNRDEVVSWSYLGSEYSSNDQGVYAVIGKQDFYATIDSKVEDKLDKDQLKQFTSAIKKGLVSKLENSVGIKFIPGKLVELKINDDLRLYTKEICKNIDENADNVSSNKKYLIVFTQKGNHDKVAKAANDCKLEVIESSDLGKESDNLANPATSNTVFDNKEDDGGYYDKECDVAIIGDGD